MAVNLKTVKDTVNLAAGVLAAAAGVVDGAKQLGFDVDGAVKSAADGATSGARAVADGIGKGFGAAAEGVGAAAGALGDATKAFQDSRAAAEARKKIDAARQSIFEGASTVMPLHEFICQQGKASEAAFNGYDMPGCYLIATYRRHDHERTSATISEYMWGQVSVWRTISCPYLRDWAIRMSTLTTSTGKTICYSCIRAS